MRHCIHMQSIYALIDSSSILLYVLCYLANYLLWLSVPIRGHLLTSQMVTVMVCICSTQGVALLEGVALFK